MQLPKSISYLCILVADLEGGRRPGVPSAPVKTSQKKDGCHTVPQVLQVIGSPSDKFLDPLLHLFKFNNKDLNNQYLVYIIYTLKLRVIEFYKTSYAAVYLTTVRIFLCIFILLWCKSVIYNTLSLWNIQFFLGIEMPLCTLLQLG